MGRGGTPPRSPGSDAVAARNTDAEVTKTEPTLPTLLAPRSSFPRSQQPICCSAYMFQLHLLQHLCWSHNGESTFLSCQVGKALQKYDLFCKGQVAFRTRCPGSRAIFEVLAKLFLDLGLWKTNKQLLDKNSQILLLWEISSIFIVDLEALKVTTTQNGDSDLLPNHPNRNMAWCIFIVFLIKTLTRAIKSPDFSARTQGMCLLVSLLSFSDSRMLFCASCSSPMATITSPARISGWPGHSSSSSTKYPAWKRRRVVNFQLGINPQTLRARQKSKVLLASQAESWSPAPACWSTRSFAVRTGPLRNNQFLKSARS